MYNIASFTYIIICTWRTHSGSRWTNCLAAGSAFTSRRAQGYECLDLYLNKPSVISIDDKCYEVRRCLQRYNGRFLSSGPWRCVTDVNRTPAVQGILTGRLLTDAASQSRTADFSGITESLLHIHTFNLHMCIVIQIADQVGVGLISIDIFRQLFKFCLNALYPSARSGVKS
jgi:hypothetical protein